MPEVKRQAVLGMHQSGNIRGARRSSVATRRGSWGEVAHAAVGILGERKVAKPIGGALVVCNGGFADQVVIYQLSREHEIVGHL